MYAIRKPSCIKRVLEQFTARGSPLEQRDFEMRKHSGDDEAGNTSAAAEIYDASTGREVSDKDLGKAKRVSKVLFKRRGSDCADLLRTSQSRDYRRRNLVQRKSDRLPWLTLRRREPRRRYSQAESRRTAWALLLQTS